MARKRSHGEGSVRKLKSGNWHGEVMDGYSADGKKRIISFSAATKTSVYKGYKQDKIEMRGDRAEMSDFPLYLNTVAGGLDCRDQTIGGFSFVVKIYAVPVVEIIRATKLSREYCRRNKYLFLWRIGKARGCREAERKRSLIRTSGVKQQFKRFCLSRNTAVM